MKQYTFPQPKSPAQFISRFFPAFRDAALGRDLAVVGAAYQGGVDEQQRLFDTARRHLSPGDHALGAQAGCGNAPLSAGLDGGRTCRRRASLDRCRHRYQGQSHYSEPHEQPRAPWFHVAPCFGELLYI
jgi:hypothetical protein